MFYPKPRSKGFDELAYYAEHFDTVEVNATFYGQPRAEVTRGWTRRTPAHFEFAVKLYQKFTHPRVFSERVAKMLRKGDPGGHASGHTTPAGDPGGEVGRSDVEADDARSEGVEAIARPNAADLDEFRRGIDPLASAGKLGVLLAQFPPSFKNQEPSREYLASLLQAFADHAVAVELRHRSWSDDLAATLNLLNAFGAAWVQIDEPKFRFSIRQNYLPNVKGFYYMRLHGRNVERWWRHDKSEDRYDYLYSAEELKEFGETAAAAKQLVKKAYLYTNNHYSAKSVANAVMIKQQLGEPIEGEYPQEFLDRFPDLSSVVNVAHRARGLATRARTFS